jgi:hypothetical protein
MGALRQLDRGPNSPHPTIQGPKQPKGDIGREYSGQCWRSMGRSVVLFRKVVKDRYTISDFHTIAELVTKTLGAM